MQTLTQTINLTAKQDDFFTSDKMFKAFIAGRGSGKSYVACFEDLWQAFKYPGSRGVMVAPSYPMLRDSTAQTYFSLLPHEAIASYNKTTNVLKFVNGSETWFRSADNPDSLRGPNVARIKLDEAALIPKSAWDILLATLRQPKQPLSAAIFTTPKGFDWIYDWFVKTPDPESFVVYSTSIENQKNLPDGFVDALKRSYSGVFFKQEVMGEFVGFEGLVYPEFSESKHVTDELPQTFNEVIAGVDFGMRDPAAILVIGLTGGRAYVLDEHYGPGVTPLMMIEICRSMKERYHINRFICDPEEPGIITDLNRAGIPSHKANNDILPGIMEVTSRLKVQADGRPSLYVRKGLINTITEFYKYRYPEMKEGKPSTEKPMDMFNHTMDALRYALYSIKKQEAQMIGKFGSWTGF